MSFPTSKVKIAAMLRRTRGHTERNVRVKATLDGVRVKKLITRQKRRGPATGSAAERDKAVRSFAIAGEACLGPRPARDPTKTRTFRSNKLLPRFGQRTEQAS
jgi:hypothetical protein